MSDSAAFHEVDEAVRKDELKEWWDRWGTWVVAAAVLSELGVSKSQVDKLQEIPASRLVEAMIAAGRRIPSPPTPPPSASADTSAAGSSPP
mgnify:CR=1 FL=1